MYISIKHLGKKEKNRGLYALIHLYAVLAAELKTVPRCFLYLSLVYRLILLYNIK